MPDSKARQYCLVQRYSGHSAPPVDCKFPGQPLGPWLRERELRTSDPPHLTWHTPHPQYHSRPALFHASTENAFECCPMSTGPTNAISAVKGLAGHPLWADCPGWPLRQWRDKVVTVAIAVSFEWPTIHIKRNGFQKIALGHGGNGTRHALSVKARL